MIREGYMRNDVLDGLLDFGNIKQKDSMYSQAGRPDNGNGLDKGEVRHGGRNLYRGFFVGLNSVGLGRRLSRFYQFDSPVSDGFMYLCFIYAGLFCQIS